MFSLAWVCLILAGIMEPCWVIGMKKSAGFRNVRWTVVTIFFVIASMYLLALAIDMDLPVGTSYAVWTGIGALGVLVAGMILFKERSSLIRIFFIMLIIIGIAGVQINAGV
jgi:quaternary ammonium compound-resistance protein SugE